MRALAKASLQQFDRLELGVNSGRMKARSITRPGLTLTDTRGRSHPSPVSSNAGALIRRHLKNALDGRWDKRLCRPCPIFRHRQAPLGKQPAESLRARLQPGQIKVNQNDCVRNVPLDLATGQPLAGSDHGVVVAAQQVREKDRSSELRECLNSFAHPLSLGRR